MKGVFIRTFILFRCLCIPSFYELSIRSDPLTSLVLVLGNSLDLRGVKGGRRRPFAKSTIIIALPSTRRSALQFPLCLYIVP
jgi:hypothetical protein